MGKEEQGVTNDRYMLIPRTLVFLFKEDQVLLIRGAEDKRIWAGKYNGIGGHVERGEDITTAALREVYEEAGIVPQGLRLCGTITISTGDDIGIGIFVFSGQAAENKTTPSCEGKLEWVNISEVKSLPVVEDLPILINRIRQLNHIDPPFAASYSYDDQGEIIIQYHQPT